MRLRHYDLILAAFAVCLILSNVASTKIVRLGGSVFDGGTLLFPMTYVFGDVLTEVYGYARARRAIWFGLGANILGAATLGFVAKLPTDASSPTIGAFDSVGGYVRRIVLASALAFFVGEFLNSFVLARMKVATSGRFLWTRTIGSTIVGEGADTVIFTTVAFAGAVPRSVLISIMLFNYVYKVGLEVVLTPVTYRVVGFLKRSEGIDAYDRETSFNPFRRSTSARVG